MTKMIGLAFTPEQFKTLLRMIYVANTIASGVREENNSDDVREYDDLEQYIFSRANNAGFSAATWRHEAPDGEHHHPSRIFESDPELSRLIEAYDSSVVAFFLAEKLGERDIEKEHGPDAKNCMPAKDYEKLLDVHIEAYEQEFAEFGFARLVVQKDSDGSKT